ncbi:MAG: SUMF1/EgtB/PvdO family nonheme iron enzyme [Verrucomicrobia bacterium]|nr:SUMF1/EgtB/PvdO family nonheme iron enzyme [Verrucomicrobiota bacterium]
MALGLSHFTSVAAEKIDFVKQVKPILELYCVSCHSDKNAHENAELNISTKAKTFAGGEDGIVIRPGEPDKSSFYTLLVVKPTNKRLMPPKDKGGPLPKEMTDIVRNWIAQGAEWPDEVTLTAVMRTDFARDIQPLLQRGGPFNDKEKETLRLWIEQGAAWPEGFKLGGDGTKDPETALIEALHQKISGNSKEKSEAEMKAYTGNITESVTFDMVPIPGGEFLMGSPDSEAKSNPDERPQHKVKLDPFWMGKFEVTWNEYELFMYPDHGKVTQTDATHQSDVADATARPTKPYVEMSFGMGKDRTPAISMTQHAANKYCQWLSATTGHFYRLPTEAEWEYACRAGTTTAYSFGDDPAALDDYAWHGDNSEFKYQKVGRKKPNPWGLHDMHGNVAEWCLDQYDANFYAQGKDTVSVNPWNKATEPYPHVARGGSWEDDAHKLRSATRRASDPSWKQQDPQLPKSMWYHTDAQFLGIRVVRPLKVPTPEEMHKYWNSGVHLE